MTRRPDSTPAGYRRPKERVYPSWLTNLVSAILGVVAIVIIAPSIMARVLANPSSLLDLLLTPEGEYYVVLSVPIFLAVLEMHEQSHRVVAKGLGLEPTYRRWWPFNGGGYVLIQETWISRRESNLMTAAPIFTIQLSSLLVLLVVSGDFEAIAGIVFIMNASMMAKDVSDIAFNLRLPKEAQFWVSDLDEEPVEYFTVPYQKTD